METKRNTAITTTFAEYIGTSGRKYNALTLAFANGKALTIRADMLTEGVQAQALLHGLKQKLVDAAAMSRNPETGRSATIEDKFAAVQAVYERLLAGQWNATREGGGATGGMLLSALVRLYNGRKTPEQVREYLATLTDAQKTALRANSRVAPIIEQIRAERGQATDTDALLDELDGMGNEDGE